MSNLEEMDKFLKMYNHPRLNQKTKNINRLIKLSQHFFFKVLKNKSPESDSFNGEFHQTFKANTTFFKSSPKTAEEITFLNLFYEVNIILVPKSVNNTTKKKGKLLDSITDGHRGKNP